MKKPPRKKPPRVASLKVHKTMLEAILDLQERVVKLEKQAVRPMIGFNIEAQGYEIETKTAEEMEDSGEVMGRL